MLTYTIVSYVVMNDILLHFHKRMQKLAEVISVIALNKSLVALTPYHMAHVSLPGLVAVTPYIVSTLPRFPGFNHKSGPVR